MTDVLQIEYIGELLLACQNSKCCWKLKFIQPICVRAKTPYLLNNMLPKISFLKSNIVLSSFCLQKLRWCTSVLSACILCLRNLNIFLLLSSFTFKLIILADLPQVQSSLTIFLLESLVKKLSNSMNNKWNSSVFSSINWLAPQIDF